MILCHVIFKVGFGLLSDPGMIQDLQIPHLKIEAPLGLDTESDPLISHLHNLFPWDEF
jgi:hypothetical protein